VRWHLLWLWLWFTIGVLIYMFKRAYFLVKGPNPVANTYRQFVEVCWIPLLFRGVFEAGVYWLTVYPNMFNWVLSKLPAINGWQPRLDAPVPEYAVVAFFFGVFVDSAIDFLVTKIPWVKDWWPQMPPPLKAAPLDGGR
jgi:hypothetical protein